MSALRQLLTGVDGVTHDIVRWAAAAGSAAGIALAIYDVVIQHAHFDFQAYGIGFGSMLAGVGAALKLKAATEPAAQ